METSAVWVFFLRVDGHEEEVMDGAGAGEDMPSQWAFDSALRTAAPYIPEGRGRDDQVMFDLEWGMTGEGTENESDSVTSWHVWKEDGGIRYEITNPINEGSENLYGDGVVPVIKA